MATGIEDLGRLAARSSGVQVEEGWRGTQGGGGLMPSGVSLVGQHGVSGSRTKLTRSVPSVLHAGANSYPREEWIPVIFPSIVCSSAEYKHFLKEG